MDKKNNAFSLIEVIIATWILTIAVFWIYKLIWENTKIINNSWNTIQVNSLFPVLENCIENLWFNSYNTWLQYNFNFWLTWTGCEKWIINKVEFDNIEFDLIWNITNSWSNFINWELSISSDETKTITWNYLQVKK